MRTREDCIEEAERLLVLVGKANDGAWGTACATSALAWVELAKLAPARMPRRA